MKNKIIKHLAMHLITVLLGTHFFYSNISYSANCTAQTSAANNYIGNWSATLLNQPIYDPVTNSTIFTYNVTGQCNNLLLCSGNTKTGKNLSHWVIALDDGMVVKGALSSCFTSLTTAVGADPTTGLYGLKFDDGQLLGSSCNYSFYLEGAWGVELGHYAAKAGSNQISDNTAFGCTYVPAETKIIQTYKISGVSYVDINGNGVIDSDEPAVNNVNISLEGGITTLTDSIGSYNFSGLKAGTYLIDATLPESIEQYLTASSPESVSVTVGPDATQNFSYKINLQAILDDLNPYDPDNDGMNLIGEGKTIGFWKHQLNVILTGKGKAQVSKDQMLSLIASVNNFFLPVPFSPLSVQSALDVLTYNGPDAKSLLLKQLLAAEFNKFFGLGLKNTDLNNIILSSAESYAQNSSLFTREQILQLKDILDKMNNLSLSLSP